MAPAGARRLALAMMALVGLVAVLTTSRADAARWVIPPGQEAIAMRMLGGELPAGCRFLGAAIERTQVLARYACAESETRIALRHPGDAPKAVARAQQLALVVPEGAAPPEALVATIAERVREGEAGWRWIVEGRNLGQSLAAAGVPERMRRLVLPLGMAAALGFAALVLLAARWSAAAAAAAAAHSAPRAVRLLGPALLVSLGAFVYLEIGYPGAPVHLDTTRDLLMAMDCASGQGCDHGPPTSLGVIVQGALWTRFLALARVVGWGSHATRSIVLALHAISAGLMVVVLGKRFARGTALAAAALFVAASAVLLDVPIQWNPSISPLPLVLFHAALFALAEDDPRGLRSIALSAGAALSLALTTDSHVLYAVLIPPLFAAIAGLSRRPAAALAAAAAVLSATLMIDSRTAWVVNARALVEAGAAVPLAVLIVGGATAGALSRSRLARLDSSARAVAFLCVGAVCTVVMTALLFAGIGPAAGRRYLMPAVPALALGGAMLGAWIVGKLAAEERRRALIGAAMTAAACAALRLATPRLTGEGGFTLVELETVSREVYRRVPSHREVVARVRAKSPAVISALAIFEPRAPVASPGDPRDEWLLLRRAPQNTPAPGPRLTLIDLGRDVAILGAVTPRLDRARTTFCFAPRRGVSAEQGCVEARIGHEPEGPATPEERAYPALAAVRDAFPAEMLARFDGGVRQTIRIAFDAGNGEPAVLGLVDGRSGYRIDSVGGVSARARGDLPGMRVVLPAGAGEVVLAREDGGEPRPDRYWPPALLEAPEGDAALAKLVDEESGYSRPRLPNTP